MWAGGASYTRAQGEGLSPIEGKTIRRVLEKQRTGKARGADGWGPAELAMLPGTWLDALGRMMHEWETKGEWPETLRHVIFSMIPKPKAENEAGLRPIELLPCVPCVDGYTKGPTTTEGMVPRHTRWQARRNGDTCCPYQGEHRGGAT